MDRVPDLPRAGRPSPGSTQRSVTAKAADQIQSPTSALQSTSASKITTLPAALTRTLTWDQGHEMVEHVRLTQETGVEVYFCDPRVPGSCDVSQHR